MTSSLDEAVASATAPPTPNVSGHLNMSPKENLMSPLINCKQISIGGSSLLQQQGSQIVGISHSIAEAPLEPRTPTISDMNLTDRELMMISKYFPTAEVDAKMEAKVGLACGADVGMLPQGAGREEMQLTSSSPKSASPTG